MKFLVDNPRTRKSVTEWCGSRKLVIIGYYFWINGTTMQRSQVGLLRSLLFDILRRCPELIETAFPSYLDSLDVSEMILELERPWTYKTLLEGFRNIMSDDTSSTSFCIFIDGLDEYEGDHEDLLEVIKDFTNKSNLKLCVASRPWPVFEEALGEYPKLYLQELTRADMALYVKDKLELRRDFQALKLRRPEVDELLQEIVEKSQGVFLWVYLVVQSLRKGMQNADRLEDLQRRLRAFPSDLNSFFEHIITSLDPIYRTQTARGFQAALSAHTLCSVMNFWYLDQEEASPNFAMRMQISDSPEFRKADQELKVETMTTRINGRFKGMLEVSRNEKQVFPFNAKVDFLHRTVKDYLMTKDAQQFLSAWTPDEFDVYRSLCNTTLAEIKELVVTADTNLRSPLALLVSDMFFYAMQYERRQKHSLTSVLLEMNKSIGTHLRILFVGEVHKIESYQDEFWSRLGQNSFMRTAVACNAKAFVKDLIDQNSPHVSPSKREEYVQLVIKLLNMPEETIVVLQSVSPIQGLMAVDPEMVRILVEREPRITLEVDFAKVLKDKTNRELGYSIVKCLCQNGAIKRKSFKIQEEAIRSLIGEEDTAELLSLLKSSLGHNPSEETTTSRFKSKFASAFGIRRL